MTEAKKKDRRPRLYGEGTERGIGRAYAGTRVVVAARKGAGGGQWRCGRRSSRNTKKQKEKKDEGEANKVIH